MFYPFFVLGLAIGCGGAAPRSAVDACSAQWPNDLRLAVQERFSDYRLPRVADNLEEDVEYHKQHGGNGCIGATTADLNGDGHLDHALLLSPVKGEGTLLVAALRGKEGWEIERLRVWTGDRRRLYVAKAAPGTYRRSESFDTPPSEPGEQESVESRLDGLVTGRTEASGIYYFLTPQGWLHVWAVD